MQRQKEQGRQAWAHPLPSNLALLHPASREAGVGAWPSLQMTRNKRALIKLSGVHGSTPSCGHSACLFLSAQIKNSSFYPEGWTKSKLSPVSGAQSGGEPVENQRKPTDNSSSWWKVNTLLSFHFSPTLALASVGANETGNVLIRVFT